MNTTTLLVHYLLNHSDKLNLQSPRLIVKLDVTIPARPAEALRSVSEAYFLNHHCMQPGSVHPLRRATKFLHTYLENLEIIYITMQSQNQFCHIEFSNLRRIRQKARAIPVPVAVTGTKISVLGAPGKVPLGTRLVLGGIIRFFIWNPGLRVIN